ncbi:pilus assembly protein [Rubrivivax gelatinosus]|uniref:Pyrrolo-quinoline quinone n=1 Tax=Rubrivivax gelatinosus TaxID=28068 RepID=A0ABS1DXL7_RUBGE|nr:PilC/PilY family type IV pilus protein [Rubrivivax gelatinosus]MBK1713475.1 pyrrolo-quinoline quinone [Rubrivivax gelatinosus]
MKTVLQISASVLSLAALLAGTAASATDVAQLPLKASVLAKPNVIFAMDDSGSMDWEVLLDTTSGLAWWNGSTMWDSSKGKPLKTNSSYDPYAFLFPVGTATGGQIYTYDSVYGHAAPPTPQFAWLRSATFNPIYYDPGTTYAAWSPAYVDLTSNSTDDGSKLPFSNASTSSTPSHPLYPSGPALALATSWTSSNSKFSTNGYTFYAQKGVKLPSGTYVKASSTTSGACSGSTWRTLTAEVTVSSGTCQAAIPYYPATYWHAESCTVDSSTCILGPDGTTKLKKYEITSGNTYPSGRSYADELQNFANWFSFYRKRKLMLAGSMGEVLEGLTGLRLGVVAFNNLSAVTMYDTDATAAKDNGLRVTGLFYNNGMEMKGTPTHATVRYIGKQYDENQNIIKYACQRNNTFVVTDGFSNTASYSDIPSYTSSTYGSGSPYATTPTGSLADLALSQYTLRLRTGLAAGKVPKSTSTAANADKNTNLHINTYAISLGVRGSLWPTETDPFEVAPTWATPVADDPSMIDDQWHATINGRGLMFLATTPTETASSIRAILNDIISQTGAQSGVAVSTVNLTRGDGYAYMATYNPSGWSGDLTANVIDPATAEISSTASWSADAQLRARNLTTNPREIATHDGSGGVAFTATNIGSTVNPSSAYGDSAELVAYLRGDRSLEGTTYRSRTSLIGAVISAEPVISRSDDIVYLASGEGMLHAFDIAKNTDADGAETIDGDELWAFVPNAVLPEIGETAERGYTFKTRLDGTPAIGKTGTSSRLLVAGMGAAGRAYYALDVSTPRTNTQSNAATWVKWQFPASTSSTYSAKVGQTLGKPSIVKVGEDAYRVLVTSGYNATADGYGRLFVLDAADGSVLKEYVTSEGSLTNEAGLAQVSAYLEDDGTVRYVYGGDLLGNLWRFDLSLAPSDANAVLKVAKFSNNGTAQPVTAAPELAEIDGRRIILIGTGRLLDIGDFGSSAVQTFYAVSDGSTLTSPRSTLVQRTYTRNTSTGDGTLAGDDFTWTAKRGWYMDLPAGEQANTHPALAYGAITFTTNVAGATDCTASSWLYVLDYQTGKTYENSSLVSTQISTVANSSGVNAVVTTDGKVRGLVQTGDGEAATKDLALKPTIPAARNSWREVRRDED